MNLADFEAEVTKLEPKPGDMIRVHIDRRVGGHEMDEIKASVAKLMPPGVVLMLTTPETSVHLQRKENPRHD